MEKKYVFRAEAEVLTHAEVVVCGGGTAGSFAAIAAAREGKDTVLIEKFGALGGTSVLGLVTPTMATQVKKDGVTRDPQNSYLSVELDARCAAENASTLRGTERYHDPILLGGILEEMALEAGVRILFYTSVLDAVTEDGTVRAVIVSDKEGIRAVEGDVFIDATGDGDLSVMAGAQWRSGAPGTGKNQPMSLRYTVSGIDRFRFASTVTDGSIRLRDGQFCYSSCVKQDGEREVERIMKRAKDAGDLTAEDLAYWQIFTLPNRPDTIACNCPEFFVRVNGTKAGDLTAAQLDGKRAIRRHMAFYRKYFLGFENAYVSAIAPMVGVRESREIVTDRVLTLDDACRFAKFGDAVAQTNYSIDVHGFGDAYSNRHVGNGTDAEPWFEVPYGALTVKGFRNLLVAGRAIGCDFFTEAAIRIIPTCRATGEAAGIAASIAAERGIHVHDVDGKEVRALMIRRGADFV